jgi:hypothetical protein
MTGVLEKALLLNLRPAVYYIRARRNGVLAQQILDAVTNSLTNF